MSLQYEAQYDLKLNTTHTSTQVSYLEDIVHTVQPLTMLSLTMAIHCCTMSQCIEPHQKKVINNIKIHNTLEYTELLNRLIFDRAYGS